MKIEIKTTKKKLIISIPLNGEVEFKNEESEIKKEEATSPQEAAAIPEKIADTMNQVFSDPTDSTA